MAKLRKRKRERVLFLDDDRARLTWFRVGYKSGHFVETAEEAIVKLREKIFDVAFLDHDLGGEVFVDSNRKDCGMEVCRWLIANKKPRLRVIVHSRNTPAAEEMVKLLRQAGYKARNIPFPELPNDFTEVWREREGWH